MKLRKFVYRVTSLGLVVCMLCGCSKNDYSGLNTVTLTPSPIVIDTVEPVVTTEPAPSPTDIVPDAQEGATPSPEITSAEVTPTVEVLPTEAPTATPAPITPVLTRTEGVSFKGSLEIPSDITDPIDKIEYIRKVLVNNTDYYDSLDNSSNGTWCFKRMKDHSQSGTYEYFAINNYNSYYVNRNVSDNDKVIYLTFDCGYPSDLTVQILDTLAAHNAKANFFVTKMYLKDCAEYAIRMKEEGHMVCNHTVSHTDLTNQSVEKIAKEILDCAEYFYQVTGYEFDPFFRTPTGAYTKRLLTLISDAGYTTVFWSIAYGDYDKNNQPAPGYVLEHFTTYHHNGAIALMHNDSTSNVNELDAVLTMLEEQGYRFGLLDEFLD